MWLHTCRHPTCCPVESSTSASVPARRGKRPLTIDLHCHTLIPAVEKLVAGTPQKAAEPELMLKSMGRASVEHNNAVMLPQTFPKLTRVEQRLADMDAMGVDVQLLSPTATQYCYWAEPDLAVEIVRVQNEAIAHLCAEHPTRLAGLGTVALQHPRLGCEQLEHAVKGLGLKGVVVSTFINGKDLAHPDLRPFWAKAEALGALVFIHPFGTTLGDRLASHYLVNTIGQPLETTIALSQLIFHGVLDAHPGLKILAAHGGGFLPTYIGRSDHAHAVRPEAGVDTKKRPGEHLKKIWFDTVVYDPMAVRHLVDRVGVGQIVVGTDYPFDMGHYDVHRLIEATPGLSAADREALLGGNAARLIGWPVAASA